MSAISLPTFFLIGASKSGTTSLNHYLGTHPEIAMAEPQEPHQLLGPNYEGRLGNYGALYTCDARLRGETSSGYANYPYNAEIVDRIADTVPDARLYISFGIRSTAPSLTTRSTSSRATSTARLRRRWRPPRRTTTTWLQAATGPRSSGTCADSERSASSSLITWSFGISGAKPSAKSSRTSERTPSSGMRRSRSSTMFGLGRIPRTFV